MSSKVQNLGFKPLGSVTRRAVTLSEDNLVRRGYLRPGQLLPLVFTPTVSGVKLAAWARAHAQLIKAELSKHGAILFRGFMGEGQEGFEAFLEAVSLERMHYVEGATPRTELGNHIYTSTEFPAEHSIALHNELSYSLTWPMKIAFFCVEPPETGGETPVADVRRVLDRIDPAVRRRFVEKGWMLVRNYGDGLSLPWQSVFRTSDKAELERYCAESRVLLEWKDGGRVRTRHVRPASAAHPETGEAVWFNHIAFWHISSLDEKTRGMLLRDFGEDGVPYNTYYGDGSPIEDSVVEELRRAYDLETVQFRWEKGDLLLMDNMLAAHGRNPYAGSRRIIVGMGEPHTRHDLN
jgi:alpha-ketoglutarate-dependent taurine dioxygenase